MIEVNRHINFRHLITPDLMTAQKMLGRALMMGIKPEAVGSRSIEGAANKDSDIDYLVLDKMVDGKSVRYWLKRNGFEPGGSVVPEGVKSEFESYKKGKVNFILTRSEEWFKNFLSANTICQMHKVTNKEDRVAVFDFIMGKGAYQSAKERYDYILANGSSKGYTEACPF